MARVKKGLYLIHPFFKCSFLLENKIVKFNLDTDANYPDVYRVKSISTNEDNHCYVVEFVSYDNIYADTVEVQIPFFEAYYTRTIQSKASEEYYNKNHNVSE